jgi:hypothetical protein
MRKEFIYGKLPLGILRKVLKLTGVVSVDGLNWLSIMCITVFRNIGFDDFDIPIQNKIRYTAFGI